MFNRRAKSFRAPAASVTAAFLLLHPPAWGTPERPPVDRAEVAPSADALTLDFPGVKGPVEYEKFGHFEGTGTALYRYVLTDREGLAQAVGEGVYPNTDALKAPAYRELQKSGKLEGNQWRFTDTPTAALNFFKWASAPEDPGVKQFYQAMMLERLGLMQQAVRAYYAVAVHFPKTISYTYFGTPWYVAPAALDRMEELLRRHPGLRMRWTGGGIQIPGRFGKTPTSGPFIVDPGRLVADARGQALPPADLSKEAVVQTIGGPRVQLRKYANHHWRLFVDEKPFVIKALTYSVTPIGLSPDRGNWDVSRDWQLLDTNKNGLHDGFFESYVDKNGNGKQDPDEPTVGDAKLLAELGVNTLRAYHHLYNKELFRRLYKDYGFYVLCGDVLGGYAVGSGATWEKGTDYRDPAQLQRMLDGVRTMVEEYKDEPYILMWVLGNENVFGVGNNSGTDPEAFFELVERAAKLVHQLDPTRPVAVANGDVLFLDVLARKAPDVDVIGMNVYRGEQGFGRHLFLDVRNLLDKPAMITEFGAPAFADGYSAAQGEAYQAMYLGNNWEDLQAHMAGRGVGNALGGDLFEWTDEWWKANSDLPPKIQKEHAEWYASKAVLYKNLQPQNHDKVPQFGLPFLDGWSYEEWFGLTSQGSGKGSPFARNLRPSYDRMKDAWNSP